MIKIRNLLLIFILYSFIINGFGNNDSKKINENCANLLVNSTIIPYILYPHIKNKDKKETTALIAKYKLINKKITYYKEKETNFVVTKNEFDAIQELYVLNNFFNYFINYQNSYSDIVQIKIEKSNYSGFSGIITEKKGRINKTADSYEIISPLIIKLI